MGFSRPQLIYVCYHLKPFYKGAIHPSQMGSSAPLTPKEITGISSLNDLKVFSRDDDLF
ncbi:MAG: hypothetical protein MjAS7_0992 [Metallosphaera javensis (ex Sakai et al. 2022)]|nr:MAG: hypothetical protein MjAS7_0992 [Metallosphaera javensis (ex Sakai et al. 2022)]